MIGWLRGELLARTAEGELLRRRPRRGYRVNVPGPVLAAVRRPRRTRSSSTCTRTCARTPSSCTGSPPPTSGAASRRCSVPTAWAPRWPSPSCPRLRPADLVRAVLDEDLAVLCAVPGIGRKTAARLVLDLRSKLELPELSATGVPGGAGVAGRAVRGTGRARSSSATGPTRSGGPSTASPRRVPSRSCCATCCGNSRGRDERAPRGAHAARRGRAIARGTTLPLIPASTPVTPPSAR